MSANQGARPVPDEAARDASVPRPSEAAAPGTAPRAPVGALLIHGLGGTQYDLGSMHKVLKRAGIETHSLTLPGHGTQPEDLAGVTVEHWLDAVTAKYREVVDRYDTLHVMGMCMGALLAVELCKRERHAKGKLISLAAPVYIDGWSTPWYRDLRPLLYWIPGLPARMRIEEEDPFGIKNELIRSIVKAKFERGENFHYRWVPLACVRQVDRLRAMVRRGLGGMACPALVVHAHEDELTSARSARFLQSQIPQCEMVLLDNSYHMICVDNDREQVADEALRFLGFDPAEIRLRQVEEEDVPMADDAVRALVARYLDAMRGRRFEELFPMFSGNVRWQQGGDNPLAGLYVERSRLIDLFSSLMAYSGNSFAFSHFDEPVFDGQHARIGLRFTLKDKDGGVFEGEGEQRLRLRNGRVAEVSYEARDPVREDALWHRLAAQGATPNPVLEGGVSPEVAALAPDALAAAFRDAQEAVKALPDRPSNAVLLQLYAFYKQGSDGDAGANRPGLTDPVGRAKYDAWQKLRGLDRAAAQGQYVSLVARLRR